MHPIERLRFVARAEGVPADVLAVEATTALMTFAGDPAALVAGCRRVLARQVSCGPLWWSCARLLTAASVRETAVETVRLIEGDTTSASLSLAIDALPTDHDRGSADGDPDAGGDSAVPTLVRALAIGSSEAIVVRSADPAAGGDDGAVWLVGSVGCRLADPLWDALTDHWPGPRSRGEERVPLDGFTHVVGPSGPVPVDALGAPDCPVAPELFRLAG